MISFPAFHRNRFLLWLVFAAGLAGIASVSWKVKKNVDRDAERAFDGRCRELQVRVEERLQSHARILRGGASFFSASEEVTRDDWRIYMELQKIEENLPGLQGIGFSLLIAPDQLECHIQKIRSEGFPEYSVKPQGIRALYSAVIYLEPFDATNQQIFGYDLLAEPAGRAAMERARDEHIAVLSNKVFLPSGKGAVPAGALFVVPVYRKGMPDVSVQQRRTALSGWVFGSFQMGDLLQGILNDQGMSEKQSIGLQVFDGLRPQPETLLYQSSRFASTFLESNVRFEQFVPIDFNGHRWTLQIVQSAEGVVSAVRYAEAWLSLLVGTLIAFLLFALIWSLLNTREKAQKMAQNLTVNLRDERQRMAGIIEGTNVGTWEWNVLTGEVVINDKWAELLGYTLDELSPVSIQTWEKMTHPDDLKQIGVLLKKHFSGEIAFYNSDFRMKHKDGRWVWIQDRGKVSSRTAGGQPLMMFGTHMEIDERKRTEERISCLLEESDLAKRSLLGIIEDNARSRVALQQSEAALVEAQSIACMGSYILNISSNRWTGSATLDEVLGIDENYDRSIDGWVALIHPDDRTMMSDYLKNEVIGKLQGMNMEFRIVRPSDGAVRWIQGIGRLVLDDKGAPVKLAGTNQDITERKQAEEALRTTREQLEFALKRSLVGAWDLDLVDHSSHRTPGHDRIFGYETPLTDWTYEMFLDHVLPEDRAEVDRKFQEAVASHCDWDFECRIRRPDDEVRWIWGVGGHQLNADGKALRMSGIVQDITERKQAENKVLRLLSEVTESRRTLLSAFEDQKKAEAEIRTLNDELEQRVAARTADLEVANKELESFSYSVSHDLRTPLRAIDGFSHALQEDLGDQLDEACKDHLQRVRAAAQRMACLIDDLLRLSRLGREPLIRRHVDLSALVQLVVEKLQAGAPSRVVDVQVEANLQVDADPRLIEVVIENLLGNAWKFTGKISCARIEFGCLAGPQSAAASGDAFLKGPVFFVRDNGAGFDMQYAEKLFGAFQRLHSTSEFPGSGIGLATVARIIHRHGGRVWAESAVKQGATFYFTLDQSAPSVNTDTSTNSESIK